MADTLSEAIQHRHRLYALRAPQWEEARDALEGPDVVQVKGTRYLPRPSGFKDTTAGNAEYAAYVRRTIFPDGPARCVDGMVGLIQRKPAAVELGSVRLNARLDDITGDLVDFTRFSELILREESSLTWFGIMADYSAAEQRAYLSLYTAENIWNWRFRSLPGGRRQLSQVVLHEEEEIELRFGTKAVEQIRVIELVTATGEPAPAVIVGDEPVPVQAVAQRWRRQETRDGGTPEHDAAFVPIEEPVALLRRDEPVLFIPWRFANEMAEPPRPFIDAVVKQAFDFYRMLADLRHYQHFASLPTWWAAGWKFQTGQELHAGSSAAWVSENPQARAGVIEPTGTSIRENRAEMAAIEQRMVANGAELLEDPQAAGGNVTATAIRYRSAARQSRLTDIAQQAEHALRGSLVHLVWWETPGATIEEVDKQVTLQFNRDYVDVAMEPDAALKLSELWFAKFMSREVAWWNMRRGELWPPGWTPQQEAEAIEREHDELSPPVPAPEPDTPPQLRT